MVRYCYNFIIMIFVNYILFFYVNMYELVYIFLLIMGDVLFFFSRKLCWLWWNLWYNFIMWYYISISILILLKMFVMIVDWIFLLKNIVKIM